MEEHKCGNNTTKTATAIKKRQQNIGLNESKQKKNRILYGNQNLVMYDDIDTYSGIYLETRLNR